MSRTPSGGPHDHDRARAAQRQATSHHRHLGVRRAGGGRGIRRRLPAQAAGVARAPGHARATPALAAATPRGREWAAFAYYPPKNELVLFGGRRPGTVFGDTWTRTGSTWTQAPPGHLAVRAHRRGHGLRRRPASQLLLFGGGATTGTGFSSDTWTWNGTTWTLLHPSTSPPARQDAEPGLRRRHPDRADVRRVTTAPTGTTPGPGTAPPGPSSARPPRPAGGTATRSPTTPATKTGRSCSAGSAAARLHSG